jgi:ribosomal protein S18 acetylase RimI-like enzyme
LARDRSLKGTVAGERLLVDALLNILQASNYIAVHFVVVDAQNDYAKAFYQKFGFIEFGSLNNRMYLPMGTLKQALSNRSAD